MKLEYFLVILILLHNSRSDSVCDYELLALELKQDLNDNGILDCLRIIKPPSGIIETPEQMNKRLAAQWDTSCSFESSTDWMTDLRNTFGVTTLVDEIGEPVEQNIPEQADMCEIVRALIAAGKFKGIPADLTNIPDQLITAINCPGEENGPKICAINGISSYKKEMWTILLTSSVITINKIPKFIKDADTKNRIDGDDQYDPGMPIDREDIKAAKKVAVDANDELSNLISSEKDFTRQNTTRPVSIEKRVSLWYSTFKEESIKPNKGWEEFNSGKLDLKIAYNSYVLVFHMVSAYAPKSRLTCRLVFDEVNQISSRMITGFSDNPSISTAFITESQVGNHVIKAQYRTNNALKINVSNQDDHNLTIGSFVIPYTDLKFKKIINPEEIQLFNSNNWGDFPNLSASVKLLKSSYVLIMYSISMPGMESHLVTSTEINNTPIFQSRSICGDSTYLNIHNTSIVRLNADVDYRIKIKYRTPYPARSNPRMNDWESQSLTILQLPQWFEMQVLDIEEEFVLNCEGEWNLFPKMDIDLELEDDKSILFLYNVVLPLVEKEISIGIFVNDILDVLFLFRKGL